MFLLEMDLLPRILTLLFLITAMLSVGLRTTTNDLRVLIKSKGFLVRALLANFVAVPIVGIVLTRTLPFAPQDATALLLLACTPGGISALQFTTKIKGAASFAGSSAFLMTFAAVFLSPALLTFVLPGDVSVKIPYGRAVLFVLIYLLLPLAAGTLLRGWRERLAERLLKLSTIMSAVFFIIVVALLMGMRKEAANVVGKEALFYMLLFNIISMAVGWFMGGPTKETRWVLAAVTGMRHVALCLIIALKTFSDPAIRPPLLAFSALMVPPNTLLTVYMVIRSRKAGRGSQQ